MTAHALAPRGRALATDGLAPRGHVAARTGVIARGLIPRGRARRTAALRRCGP
jgi:hypothetical protein